MASAYYTNVGKEVVDGDVAYANDLNSVNTDVDVAFQLVENEIDTVAANMVIYLDKAEKWAEETEDVEIEPGLYSAHHWANKAEDQAILADADATQTALDVIATAADVVQTGLDAVATAADRVQTGLDVVAAAASADIAAELAVTNFMMNNYIINGDMRIAQRGTSGLIVGGSDTYTLDRWCGIATGANITVVQSTAVLAEGYTNTLVGAGATGNTLFDVFQRIEGSNVAALRGNTVTLDFYTLTTDGTSITIEVSYADAVDTWTTKTLIDSTTITPAGGSYVKGSFSFVMPSLYTHQGIEIRFKFGATVLTKQVGLTKVRLSEGAESSAMQERPIGLELLLCQRYYETGVVNGIASAYSSVYVRLNSVMFKVTKRSTTVMSISGVVFTGYAGTPGTLYSTNSSAVGFAPTYNWTSGTVGLAFTFSTLTYTSESEL